MSREDFEAIKQLAKEKHAKRVSDNPNRIQYAIEQFEKHNFETKSYDANTRLNDTESSRYGNFVIDKSLINAIHNAVNDWNGRNKKKGIRDDF